MDKNKKVLLKIFDLDDEIVDDLDLDVNINQNKLYIKFKKIIKCCSNCGSVKFLNKGFYKTRLIGCPFNENLLSLFAGLENMYARIVNPIL